MNSKIVEKDGWLYIQDPFEPSYSKPEAVSLIWPVDVRAVDSGMRPGDNASRGTSGIYYWAPGNGFQSRCIVLPQGGQTQCAWTVTMPLKSPRGGPWEYVRGEWLNTKTGRRVRAAVP